MSRAVSPSVDRVYGLLRVARCWNVSRATVYRHRQAPAGAKRRPGPVGPCDDATLLQHIRQVEVDVALSGEPPDDQGGIADGCPVLILDEG